MSFNFTKLGKGTFLQFIAVIRLNYHLVNGLYLKDKIVGKLNSMLKTTCLVHMNGPKS